MSPLVPGRISRMFDPRVIGVKQDTQPNGIAERKSRETWASLKTIKPMKNDAVNLWKMKMSHRESITIM